MERKVALCRGFAQLDTGPCWALEHLSWNISWEWHFGRPYSFLEKFLPVVPSRCLFYLKQRYQRTWCGSLHWYPKQDTGHRAKTTGHRILPLLLTNLLHNHVSWLHWRTLLDIHYWIQGYYLELLRRNNLNCVTCSRHSIYGHYHYYCMGCPPNNLEIISVWWI